MTTEISRMPAVETLSERQLRGADCVFCGLAVSREEVRDLGQRKRRVFGLQVSWFPRAHPRCAEGGGS
ncbi:hypothetical protein [Streptomyces sp. NPDC088725]|uniref:hypothetical protein n=1 Tax=Streptomyces sp. NPDC088725 TaxID=3365873 RepID=UPI00381E4F7D